MTRYTISGGEVLVTARSSIHDTRTVFGKVDGTVELDRERPSEATGEVRVDMRVFDAGDRLKNWKLKSDLKPEEHPFATFTLARLADVKELGDGRLEATAEGTLSWRGRSVALRARGSATLGEEVARGEAEFELDVRDLGVKPPKFLMFKVENDVSVRVTLKARA